ncbi:Rrf2 family transcriptional regulator [Rickettsiales endosymbiont of Stachyamoeba lipophora]|uniref:Rrf2 family transcriptional regulator n=1 Tax=Rickettsiales endosymbiont of Stachyamoeba lipophora TaxID=2486578 RepID=UPI000F6561C3|nr:Rrf2 family transcriptional regulator [Rickettsiales endosymbiont of Stachyamoeba lipophora]AZL15212.1 Rrf2 family transcriptional regulator [Rickettsiales endosymbiont of Stachyamoeba lipophora]
MMLTTKGRYAVMALADMLSNHANDLPITLHQISARQEIPLNYLEQIFSMLKRNNIVISFKGPGGGYKIHRPLNEVNIADIIHAVEESIKMTRCNPAENGGCMSTNTKCLVHDLWNELGNKIENYLESITLDDLKNGTIIK